MSQPDETPSSDSPTSRSTGGGARITRENLVQALQAGGGGHNQQHHQQQEQQQQKVSPRRSDLIPLPGSPGANGPRGSSPMGGSTSNIEDASSSSGQSNEMNTSSVPERRQHTSPYSPVGAGRSASPYTLSIGRGKQLPPLSGQGPPLSIHSSQGSSSQGARTHHSGSYGTPSQGSGGGATTTAVLGSPSSRAPSSGLFSQESASIQSPRHLAPLSTTSSRVFGQPQHLSPTGSCGNLDRTHVSPFNSSVRTPGGVRLELDNSRNQSVEDVHGLNTALSTAASSVSSMGMNASTTSAPQRADLLSLPGQLEAISVGRTSNDGRDSSLGRGSVFTSCSAGRPWSPTSKTERTPPMQISPHTSSGNLLNVNSRVSSSESVNAMRNYGGSNNSSGVGFGRTRMSEIGIQTDDVEIVGESNSRGSPRGFMSNKKTSSSRKLRTVASFEGDYYDDDDKSSVAHTQIPDDATERSEMNSTRPPSMFSEKRGLGSKTNSTLNSGPGMSLTDQIASGIYEPNIAGTMEMSPRGSFSGSSGQISSGQSTPPAEHNVKSALKSQSITTKLPPQEMPTSQGNKAVTIEPSAVFSQNSKNSRNASPKQSPKNSQRKGVPPPSSGEDEPRLTKREWEALQRQEQPPLDRTKQHSVHETQQLQSSVNTSTSGGSHLLLHGYQDDDVMSVASTHVRLAMQGPALLMPIPSDSDHGSGSKTGSSGHDVGVKTSVSDPGAAVSPPAEPSSDGQQTSSCESPTSAKNLIGKSAVKMGWTGSRQSSNMAPFICNIALRSFQLTSHDEPVCVPVSVKCAILFIDMSGYSLIATALESKGAFALFNAVNTYLVKLLDVVAMFGGEVIKFAGDAVICMWYGGNQKKNVQTAAHAALYMQKHTGYHPVSGGPEGSDLSFGIHSGLSCGSVKSVVFRGHGVKNMQNHFHMISGDPMNQISACANAAKRGEVCCTKDALQYLCPTIVSTMRKAAAGEVRQDTMAGASISNAHLSVPGGTPQHRDSTPLGMSSSGVLNSCQSLNLSGSNVGPGRSGAPSTGTNDPIILPMPTLVDHAPSSVPNTPSRQHFEVTDMSGSSTSTNANHYNLKSPNVVYQSDIYLIKEADLGDSADVSPSSYEGGEKDLFIPKVFSGGADDCPCSTMRRITQGFDDDDADSVMSDLDSLDSEEEDWEEDAEHKEDNIEKFLHPAVRRRLKQGLLQSQMAEMRLLTILFIHKTQNNLDVGDWFLEVQRVIDEYHCPVVQLIDDDKGVHIVAAINLFFADREPAVTGLRLSKALVNRQAGCTVGIATGMTFCGVVGSNKASRWDVTGWTCVRACRLMEHGVMTGEPVVIGHSVIMYAGDDSLTVPLGMINIKGTADPVKVYKLNDVDTKILSSITSATRFCTKVHKKQYDIVREKVIMTKHQRQVAVMYGGSGSGKTFLCVRAVFETGIIPLVHVAIENSQQMDAAHTIAEWFSYHADPELRELAQRILQSLRMEHFIQSSTLTLELVKLTVDKGLRTAFIVKQSQCLDSMSLSLLRQTVEEKSPGAPGRWLLFLTLVPQHGVSSWSGLKMIFRQAKLTLLPVGGLDEEEAHALIEHRFGWKVTNELSRAMQEKSGRMAGCINDAITYLTGRGKTNVKTLLGDNGVIHIPREQLLRFRSLRWATVSPNICAKSSQLLDALSPSAKTILKVMAGLHTHFNAVAKSLIVSVTTRVLTNCSPTSVRKDLMTLADLNMLVETKNVANVMEASQAAFGDETMDSEEDIGVGLEFANPSLLDVVLSVTMSQQIKQVGQIAAGFATESEREVNTPEFFFSMAHYQFQAGSNTKYRAAIKKGVERVLGDNRTKLVERPGSARMNRPFGVFGDEGPGSPTGGSTAAEKVVKKKYKPFERYLLMRKVALDLHEKSIEPDASTVGIDATELAFYATDTFVSRGFSKTGESTRSSPSPQSSTQTSPRNSNTMFPLGLDASSQPQRAPSATMQPMPEAIVRCREFTPPLSLGFMTMTLRTTAMLFCKLAEAAGAARMGSVAGDSKAVARVPQADVDKVLGLATNYNRFGKQVDAAVGHKLPLPHEEIELWRRWFPVPPPVPEGVTPASPLPEGFVEVHDLPFERIVRNAQEFLDYIDNVVSCRVQDAHKHLRRVMKVPVKGAKPFWDGAEREALHQAMQHTLDNWEKNDVTALRDGLMEMATQGWLPRNPDLTVEFQRDCYLRKRIQPTFCFLCFLFVNLTFELA